MAEAGASFPAAAGSANVPPRGRPRLHSRIVRTLRIVLPLIMVGVVAVLVTLVSLHAARRRAAAHKDASSPIRMVNPHFFGRDNQGRAYTLGARQASRDETSFQTVLLSFPFITLDGGGAHPSTLSADTGVYREDTRILVLKGHVRGADAKSTRLATDQAVVNTRTGTVTSASAIEGESGAGGIRANSFDVQDKGDRVILKGGVHARLNAH